YKAGDLFILDMGEPVKIVELARDMIRLSGRSEDDIPIVFSGTRPGEKLFEELTLDQESVDTTEHKKIFVGKNARQDFEELRMAYKALGNAAEHGGSLEVRRVLRDLVPTYGDGDEELAENVVAISAAKERLG
ncbi:MAG: polysaccharide biosynthesis protein, partial [Bradymonadaceae bacterium]